MVNKTNNVLELLDALGKGLKDVLINSKNEDLNPKLEEAIETLKTYCKEHKDEIENMEE